MAKNLMGWMEPSFFVLRLRTLREWLWRLAIMVGIALTVFVVLLMFGRNPRNWVVGLEMSLLLAAILTFVIDLAYWHRDIQITDAGIEWVANAGKFAFRGEFPFANIVRIDCFRPGEWKFPFGGLILWQPNGESYAIAVPKGKKLETVATILFRQGLEVNLSGWVPTTADTRTRVEDELVLGGTDTVTKDAVFLVLPPEEPRLAPVNGRVIAAIIGIFPLLLALVGMIGTWVYLGMYWGQLSVLERSLIGAGGVGGFILAFLYIMAIGQHIESALLVSMARKNLRSRLDPAVDLDGEDVFSVSVNPRENWTKVATMSPDFGFLQMDQRKSALMFEGNKERWTIPITALTAIRIEEAQVGKEGEPSSEIRYFVVLSTHRDGQPWEVGLTRTRTEWGFDGQKSRRERMGRLFDDLRASIGQG